MDCTSTSIPYQQIGSFSKIIVDYLDNATELKDFYKYRPTLEGVKKSIESRKAYSTNRELLVTLLQQQYKELGNVSAVHPNINLLAENTSFTVVTAHQPNIFTGYLYFIYKILHTIKLAAFLGTEMPQYKFIPVYYMGSEDADLDELGNIHLNGEKLTWDTQQQGAVGRMKNTGLGKIIERVSGELSSLPYGEELVDLLKESYLHSPDIQTATFRLVNALFGEYGLIVLIPDSPLLKDAMNLVFQDDLLQQLPSSIVGATITRMSEHYKVQATPREINLFYLKDDIRNRIVTHEKEWRVVDTNIKFTRRELLQELNDYPDRFSPNVILRGLYQETILPNIAFIGGGGEMAYWLELKDLFSRYGVPYPVLILRNSFLFIEKSWQEKIDKLGFQPTDLFKNEKTLIEEIVKKESGNRLDLSNEVSRFEEEYAVIINLATTVDATLNKHVKALQAQAINRLHILEKKMLSAEKKKFEAQQRQVHNIKEKLFPKNSLQERIDNFMPYYARYGKEFIQKIYEYSPTLEQAFVVLTEI
jgi:bacillithiol biosynthesis cysteine-adding enzyme BshC